MTELDVAGLQRRLTEFAAARGWEPYHTPKNLASALSVEAAELLEIFQWLTPEQADRVMDDPESAHRVEDEVADVLAYLLQFCGVLGVDVLAALAAKIDRPGTARATLVAMGTVVIGLLLGALAIEEVSPLLVLGAAVFLGAGYGLTLESGLAEIGRLAPPGALPTVSALFQGVAHSGFLAPLLLAVMARSASYPELLAGLALIGLILLIGAAVHAARHAHHDPARPDPTPQELTWEE